METKEKKKRAAKPRQKVQAPPKRRRAAAPAKPPKAVNTDVVYTAPEPFSRKRFLLRLLTVVAVVLALTFGMSIFFKVENVVVTGTEKYTAWDIREASGLQTGENLLTVSESQVSGRITTKLPYVQKVRVGIKLPDTVHIEITELDVVYAIEAADGGWWLIDADGRVVEHTTPVQAKNYTQLLGVKIQSPQIGQNAVALEPEPEGTVAEGETVPVTVKGSEQLAVLISVLQYLEDNGVLGEAASVDVTSLVNLQIWYGDRYQILLGDTTQLGYKISTAATAIDQLDQYQSGVLDVSFTTWKDQVGYTPFQ